MMDESLVRLVKQARAWLRHPDSVPSGRTRRLVAGLADAVEQLQRLLDEARRYGDVQRDAFERSQVESAERMNQRDEARARVADLEAEVRAAFLAGWDMARRFDRDDDPEPYADNWLHDRALLDSGEDRT